MDIILIISILVQVVLYISIFICVLCWNYIRLIRKKKKRRAVPLRVWSVDKRQKTTYEEKVNRWMETAEFRADPYLDIEGGFNVPIPIDIDTTFSETSGKKIVEKEIDDDDDNDIDIDIDDEREPSPKLPIIADDDENIELPNTTNIDYSISSTEKSSTQSVRIERINQ